jgi:hypothetical protein
VTDTKIPDHAEIEKWVKHQPLEVIARLPDSIERREAERLIRAAETVAHVAREKHARED